MTQVLKKIEIDENGLQIEPLDITDTYGQIIEKTNRNFREIVNNGGGPVGLRGKQGPPGPRGKPGPKGKDGENVLEEWENTKPHKSCDFIGETFEGGVSEVYGTDFVDIVVNKYANKSTLLTNLTITNEDELRIDPYDSELRSFSKVSADFADYKLKIYNSDENGKGKNIHILNSKRASENSEFLCRSGFVIEDDVASNSNTEELFISAIKNENISGHTHKVNLISDKLTLGKTKDGSKQKLSFDTGTTTDTNNAELAIVTEPITGLKEQRLTNRDGYVGVWQKTNEFTDKWEVITNETSTDVVITRLTQTIDNVDTTLTYNDIADYPVSLHQDSYIRFKRLNNFVLIDYHIGLEKKELDTVFDLKNIQFKVDTKTLACRTIGWLPCSIVTNESVLIDDTEEDITHFGVFKVDSSLIGTDETFVISCKFIHNLLALHFEDGINNLFWVSGQVWATIKDEDSVCEILEITQDSICVTDFEIIQD